MRTATYKRRFESVFYLEFTSARSAYDMFLCQYPCHEYALRKKQLRPLDRDWAVKGQIMDFLTKVAFTTVEEAAKVSADEFKKRREKIERVRLSATRGHSSLSDTAEGFERRHEPLQARVHWTKHLELFAVLLMALVMGPIILMDMRMWQVHGLLATLERFPERDALQAISTFMLPAMNQTLNESRIACLPVAWRQELESKASTEIVIYGPKDDFGNEDARKEKAEAAACEKATADKEAAKTKAKVEKEAAEAKAIADKEAAKTPKDAAL